MSDDHKPEDARFDSDAFEEWVENTARSKGINRSDMLDQMLSSYWIVEELTGMMGDNSSEGSDLMPRETGQSDPEASETDPQRVENPDAEMQEQSERLEELESKVEDLTGESVSGEETAQIRRDVKEIKGRMAQLEEKHFEIDRKLSELGNSHQQLDERIEREFDSIENLFEHILDKTEELEYRVGAVADSHEDDLEPIEDHIRETDELAVLLREAQQKGISTAVCDNCITKLDLGLLDSARCPECDRAFSGLEESGWIPFSKPMIETEPIESATEGIEEGSQPPVQADRSTDGPGSTRHR